MTNAEIAMLLREVAAAYSVKDEKKYRFQIIAYEKAADAIENSTTQVKDLIKNGKIEGLPGVGPTIASRLEELVLKGHVQHFEDVMKDIPPAMFPLLSV
jgi:DNA polymerase (family 10)